MPSQCRSIISANFSYGFSRCHFECARQFSKNRRAQPSRSYVPELPELLLEEVGRVQPLVGLEQQPQAPPAIRLSGSPSATAACTSGP